MQEGKRENVLEKMCWRAGESSTGCAGDAGRKPAPGIRHIQPNSHRLVGGLAGLRKGFAGMQSNFF